MTAPARGNGNEAAPAVRVTHDPEIPVRLVRLQLCDLCIDGQGEQCHTPGCALWLNRPPDHPIRESLSVVAADAVPASQAARSLAGIRSPVTGLIGMWDGMRKVCTLSDGEWEDWRAVLGGLIEELASHLDVLEAASSLPRLADAIDPGKLELLAGWFDEDDLAKGRDGRTEVQEDLRRWAALVRASREGTACGSHGTLQVSATGGVLAGEHDCAGPVLAASPPRTEASRDDH